MAAVTSPSGPRPPSQDPHPSKPSHSSASGLRLGRSTATSSEGLGGTAGTPFNGDSHLCRIRAFVKAMVATIMYAAGDVRTEDVPDARLTEPTDAVVRVTRAYMC